MIGKFLEKNKHDISYRGKIRIGESMQKYDSLSRIRVVNVQLLLNLLEELMAKPEIERQLTSLKRPSIVKTTSEILRNNDLVISFAQAGKQISRRVAQAPVEASEEKEKKLEEDHPAMKDISVSSERQFDLMSEHTQNPDEHQGEERKLEFDVEQETNMQKYREQMLLLSSLNLRVAYEVVHN